MESTWSTPSLVFKCKSISFVKLTFSMYTVCSALVSYICILTTWQHCWRFTLWTLKQGDNLILYVKSYWFSKMSRACSVVYLYCYSWQPFSVTCCCMRLGLGVETLMWILTHRQPLRMIAKSCQQKQLWCRWVCETQGFVPHLKQLRTSSDWGKLF
jgi:hypothetical protein